MALQIPWSDDTTGLALPMAYHRINNLLLDYIGPPGQGPQAQFHVLIYRDAQARQQGKLPIIDATRTIAVRNLSPTESPTGRPRPDFSDFFAAAVLDQAGHNPISQAYAWLKVQPLYQGATDI